MVGIRDVDIHIADHPVHMGVCRNRTSSAEVEERDDVMSKQKGKR